MKINKELILLSTLSSMLLTTGCFANSETVVESQSNWKAKLSSNKDTSQECEGDVCLAVISKPKTESKPEVKLEPQSRIEEEAPLFRLTETDVVVGDETITPAENPYFAQNSKIEYDYSASPFLEDHIDIMETVSTNYSENIEVIAKNEISVQVGAFRNFSGAQKYAKRYSLMNRQYSVSIEEDSIRRKSLYRVHVNGFKSTIEANSFISRYGTQGAFLVRR